MRCGLEKADRDISFSDKAGTGVRSHQFILKSLIGSAVQGYYMDDCTVDLSQQVFISGNYFAGQSRCQLRVLGHGDLCMQDMVEITLTSHCSFIARAHPWNRLLFELDRASRHL